MEKNNKKPGFFQRLAVAGKEKEKKGSCCCNFEVEEVLEEAEAKNPEKGKKNTSCCG